MKRYYIDNPNFIFKDNPLNIKNPDELFSLFLTLWSKDTCAPRLKDKWNENDPTVGQCTITSFLIQDYFGGDVYGIKLDDGNYHCFNLIDGVIMDFACEQFHNEKLIYTLEYPQDRNIHFNKKEKYKRYLMLKEKVDI